MKSLKDEIKDSLKRFSEPLEDEIINIRYAVSDRIDELKYSANTNKTDKTSTKENGGCLKKLLTYGLVLAAIVAFLRNGCSFNSTIERDGADSRTGYETSDTYTDSETLYNACIRIAEANISALILQNPIDTTDVQQEYEFLLTCLVSEYMFKSMAHGYFTGNYETTKYDYIAEKCSEITEQMKEYIDVERVDSLYTAISIEAYKSFDDTMFNYDSCLVGTSQAPDIDAMWNAYFENLVNAVG